MANLQVRPVSGGHSSLGRLRSSSWWHQLFSSSFAVSQRNGFLSLDRTDCGSLDVNSTIFAVLVITFQLSTLIILWCSIFVVVLCTFAMQYRYQRCSAVAVVLLMVLQIGAIAAQALLTLHCLFNLKLVSTPLDYSKASRYEQSCVKNALTIGYWSGIVAGAGTVFSSLLLDLLFIWSRT